VSIRSVLIVVLALVFGGSAAVTVKNLNLQGPGSPSSEVVVAAVDIPRGVTVTADMVKARAWPADGVPPGALTKPEDAVGRAARSRMVQGEPLADARLAPRGRRGWDSLIPQGMQAFTLPVPNVAVVVGGFVLPGSRVDVLLTVGETFALRDMPYGGTATTLLQNVEVFAVDQRPDALDGAKVDPKEIRSVTLLVSPEQARMLAPAQDKGKLHLALRNPHDKVHANSGPSRPDRRHQEKPKSTPPPPKAETKPVEERPKRIRTLKGSQEGWVPVVDPWEGGPPLTRPR
jgi:pilus assembly protein CpaB